MKVTSGGSDGGRGLLPIITQLRLMYWSRRADEGNPLIFEPQSLVEMSFPLVLLKIRKAYDSLQQPAVARITAATPQKYEKGWCPDNFGLFTVSPLGTNRRGGWSQQRFPKNYGWYHGVRDQLCDPPCGDHY